MSQSTQAGRRRLLRSMAATLGAMALRPAAVLAGDGEVDVAVVGAGLSGLTAARELMRAGRSVVVLEARDRVGGRTWTIPVGARRYDIGGQFVGPTQERVRALAMEFGLTLQKVYSEAKHIWELNDKRVEFTGALPAWSGALSLAEKFDLARLDLRMNRQARQVGAAAPWAAADAAALDGMSFAQWVQSHSSHPTTRDFTTVMTRAVLGADPDEVSALFWFWYVAQGDSVDMLIGGDGGAQDSVIVGGSQQISLRLAQQLGEAVKLGQAVRRLVQDENGVQAHTDGASWRARYAIVAMPPSMAQAIAFEPGLPPARRELQAQARMGRYAKVVLSYEQPFWRARGYAGDVGSLPGPVVASYDDSSPDGGPALLGFIGGGAEQAWAALPAEQRKAAVIEGFARWFGEEARRPLAYAEKDWTLDDWVRGAPTGIWAPGQLSRLGPALRQPVGRIHWAGTETASRWTGYMDGAVRAGEQAARDLLPRLA
ncbi:MAG TPA: flavin monoamine oxidase family protein [Nevskia sp.]|nr:flavin monoamine oxidase family protein [Nevskia sp.]